MKYIQLHGYILCPFSDAEVMRHHHLFPGYELLQCLRWVGKVSVHGHGHGLQAFSVEYLSGQCYKRDREGQRLDQSSFRDSQATESQGKETRKHW